MRVDTTGYPPSLYNNEPISIQCTATEYKYLYQLSISNWKFDNILYSCSFDDVSPWHAFNGLPENTFPRLTPKICESLLHLTTPPSTLNATGTVTVDLKGLQLYCRAIADLKAKMVGNFTINAIRGRPSGQKYCRMHHWSCVLQDVKAKDFILQSSVRMNALLYTSI